MSRSNFGKGLLAFIGGAALGVTLGILFAPDKGKETRKKIVKKTKNIKDSVTERFENLIESAEDIVDELKETASDFANRKEEKVEETMSKENFTNKNEM